MAQLLVVESRVGSMSRLPKTTGDGGHRLTFLTRDLNHYVQGTPDDGPHALLATENTLTADTAGAGAGRAAERLLARPTPPYAARPAVPT